VNVYNGLGNQSTSIHWHGFHQNGTSEMDGAVGFSQCPIPPGHSFTYDFNVSFTCHIHCLLS
jgi:iron transport multicopper oxidase